MIQVEGLTKYYGDYKAINNLSFHAEAGEIVGFLGANGAGKTTTMRILTGYMPPSEGTARIAGHDIFEESLKVRQAIGYLPETVPLYKEMSVWRYVDYMAGLHGMRNPERADRVDEVLEQVDMIDRADSMIASLSKGMRQRVGLAQALVHSPKVLILDEPTNGLDPRQVREVRELIRSIGEDRTVLLSTHILTEVSQLCSRVLVLNGGEIVAEDTPESLADRLEGSQRFFVRVAGIEPAALADKINSVDGVTEAYATDKGVEVTATSESNARPLTASVVVNNSWDLLELSPMGMSLEDIFIELTADDGDDDEDNVDDDNTDSTGDDN